MVGLVLLFSCFFFFNDTATTEIYTLSLHDALPISVDPLEPINRGVYQFNDALDRAIDRKSGSAGMPRPISYAVFCLKKKNAREAWHRRAAGRQRCRGAGEGRGIGRSSAPDGRAARAAGARACPSVTFFFFFNDTATTEIYTLSLHDALPILTKLLLMLLKYLMTVLITIEN